PIQISGTSLTLADYERWQLDVTTGNWSSDQNLISQSGWSLISADSQETSAEDGKATNAFDGSTSTFWHTQYTGGATPYPHEIQIDLGATYALDGFRYVPRQDGSTTAWSPTGSSTPAPTRPTGEPRSPPGSSAPTPTP